MRGRTVKELLQETVVTASSWLRNVALTYIQKKSDAVCENAVRLQCFS